MWKELVIPADTKWLRDVVTNSTLVRVTDVSYSFEKAPNICGAGWIISCTVTKREISATLVE